MKRIPFPAALAAAALLLLSCGKDAVPAAVGDGLTKSAMDADSGLPVITFTITDAYPYYYARASRPVPCDVMVLDRQENLYFISIGETCSALQWDVIEDCRAPDRRECDVAVILACETGESYFTAPGGVCFIFRIGSYDS